MPKPRSYGSSPNHEKFLKEYFAPKPMEISKSPIDEYVDHLIALSEAQRRELENMDQNPSQKDGDNKASNK